MTAINSIKQINSFINDYETVEQLMVDFAKYHVEQTLLKASEVPLITKRILFDDPKEGEDTYFNVDLVDKESILTAYPLDNIK